MGILNACCFLRLGKISAWDAFFCIAFQFIGGTLGILLAAFLFDDSFKLPPISWLATLPGAQGSWIAFAAETAVAFSLVLTLLFFMNRKKLERYTEEWQPIFWSPYLSLLKRRYRS